MRKKRTPSSTRRPVPALPAADLRQEVAGADDRPGDEVREEEDEQHEIGQVALGPHLAAVDVHDVVDGLEGVERDADGGEDLQERDGRRGAAAVQRRLQRGEEEIRILEVAEKSEVGRDADGDEHFAPSRSLEPLDAVGEEVVENGGNKDEASEVRVPAGVEVEAGGQEQQDAAAVGSAQPGEAGAEENDGGDPEELAADREAGPGGRRGRRGKSQGVRRRWGGRKRVSPGGVSQEAGARQDQKAAQPPRRHGPVGEADGQEKDQEFERTEDHDRASTLWGRRLRDAMRAGHTRGPDAASR